MTNDQFFTHPMIAELCLSRLRLDDYPTIIEPSCGNGSFFKLLPKRAIGIEIDAAVACERAVIMDFFNYQANRRRHPILVVGNPPFGRISNLAVRFFNHAAGFADTIAFIVPATFRRFSIQNRLDLKFRCQHDEPIPSGSFQPKTMKARCVFQIWKHTAHPRSLVMVQHSPDFWSCRRSEADIAMKAYGGSGDCGTIIEPEEVVNPRAYHFLKLRVPSIRQRLATLDFYPLSADTVRQDSLGMSDLYYLYGQKFPNA